MDTFKLMIIGDGASGKTCLCIRLSTGGFPEEYVPTIFDNYSMEIQVDEKPATIGLWDTAGGVRRHSINLQLETRTIKGNVILGIF